MKKKTKKKSLYKFLENVLMGCPNLYVHYMYKYMHLSSTELIFNQCARCTLLTKTNRNNKIGILTDIFPFCTGFFTGVL